MAVLAVLPTDLVGGGDDSRPNRGCRTLRDALQLKRRLPRRCQLDVHLRHPRYQRRRIHMPAQLGVDAAWVNCSCAHATCPVTPIKLDGEEDVGRLGTSVSNERVVLGVPKFGSSRSTSAVRCADELRLTSRPPVRRNAASRSKPAFESCSGARRGLNVSAGGDRTGIEHGVDRG
jgi:hypothetical protein